MSYHYSLALVEEFSRQNSSDSTLSAPLKSMNTEGTFYSYGKIKEFCHRSQFGMISQHSHRRNGRAILTWFLEDSLVKISVLQEEEKDCKEQGVVFGIPCSPAFAQFDPKSFSWKTSQPSLLGDWETFCQTFPKWGIMHYGRLYRLKTWVPSINEKEFGLWPTPTATDFNGSSYRTAVEHGKRTLREVLALIFGKKYGFISRPSPTIYPNPLFLERIMGYPIGWTELRELEIPGSASGCSGLFDSF